MELRVLQSVEIWAKGLLAAAIAGAANGVITGFAAVGIDPLHFNLQAGLRATLAIAGVSALMSAIIGTAAYLRQSPLPSSDPDAERAEQSPPRLDEARERQDRERRDGLR